jgi:hypothetical protein
MRSMSAARAAGSAGAGTENSVVSTVGAAACSSALPLPLRMARGARAPATPLLASSARLRAGCGELVAPAPAAAALGGRTALPLQARLWTSTPVGSSCSADA